MNNKQTRIYRKNVNKIAKQCAELRTVKNLSSCTMRHIKVASTHRLHGAVGLPSLFHITSAYCDLVLCQDRTTENVRMCFQTGTRRIQITRNKMLELLISQRYQGMTKIRNTIMYRGKSHLIINGSLVYVCDHWAFLNTHFCCVSAWLELPPHSNLK